MATNEAALRLSREKISISNRFLGAAAMIGAPMLLAETFIRLYLSDMNGTYARYYAVLELLYILGWICAAIGMRRSLVTGDGRSAKILFIVQITGLILAGLFNIQDMLQINAKQTGLFYNITDIAYPFSHLLMLVVGGFVVKCGAWRNGRAAAAPFLVGLALPTFFAAFAVVGFERALFIFPVMTSVGFLIIGHLIFKQKAS
jgi:hypothetical protein